MFIPPLTNYNEIIILSAVARGDQKAFEALFFRYKDRVYSTAFFYTQHEAIAEDVVQDVFIRVWKNRHKLTGINGFSSWIYTITRNRSLTALQKIAREGKKRKELISRLPARVEDAENRIQEDYMETLLEHALARLSPQQRKVFELSRLQGHSRDEVAEELNLAPATVSVHLTLALRSVKSFLMRHGELSSLLLLAALSGY